MALQIIKNDATFAKRLMSFDSEVIVQSYNRRTVVVSQYQMETGTITKELISIMNTATASDYHAEAGSCVMQWRIYITSFQA